MPRIVEVNILKKPLERPPELIFTVSLVLWSGRALQHAQSPFVEPSRSLEYRA